MRTGDPPAEVLAGELTKLADGYRRLPHSKFGCGWSPTATARRPATGSPRRSRWSPRGWNAGTARSRPRGSDLPRLGVFALGDQIAVVGNDLVAAYRALEDPRDTLIWTPGDGRVPAEKAMAAVLESTAALRQRAVTQAFNRGP